MKGTAKSPRWTYEDYLHFPEDGKRYEIIRGEKAVTPAPIPRHQIVSAKIYKSLDRFVSDRGIGIVLFSPIDVVLAEDSVVQPDLIFISKDRLSIIGERAITGAPDLVIEILSPATHKMDLVTKRRLYGAYGVREYWVVDYEAERIEIFVLEGESLEKRAEVSSGEARSLAVLPGFSVPVQEIFG